MTKHRTIVAVFVALAFPLLSAAPALSKTVCGSPEEVKAAQLRQFHYQLQVTALNCRADNPALPGKWGSYINSHGATMAANAKVMHAYFNRIGKGAAGFDRFNTVLTNRESVRVHEVEGYCDINAALFEKAMGASPAHLSTLAAEVVGAPLDIPACTESAKAERPSEKKTQKKTASAQ